MFFNSPERGVGVNTYVSNSAFFFMKYKSKNLYSPIHVGLKYSVLQSSLEREEEGSPFFGGSSLVSSSLTSYPGGGRTYSTFKQE